MARKRHLHQVQGVFKVYVLHPSQGDKQGINLPCPRDGILLQAGLPHARQNGLFLFIALGRMVTFCKEGGAQVFGLGVKSLLL